MFDLIANRSFSNCFWVAGSEYFIQEHVYECLATQMYADFLVMSTGKQLSVQSVSTL